MDWASVYRYLIAGVGAASSYLWGGWSAMIQVLLVFTIIDQLTGIFASGKEGKISSNVGWVGIAKKVAIFALVAVAHMVDVAIGQGNVVRDATICFYLANELISILENCGRLGLPVPEVLKRAVEVLKNKGESKNE